jgi:predicted metallopeptidase
MTTTTPPDETGPDVTALRSQVEAIDRLIAKQHEALALMHSLKRTLVLRLLRTQFQRLSIDEEAKLLKSYGVELPKPKT